MKNDLVLWLDLHNSSDGNLRQENSNNYMLQYCSKKYKPVYMYYVNFIHNLCQLNSFRS